MVTHFSQIEVHHDYPISQSTDFSNHAERHAHVMVTRFAIFVNLSVCALCYFSCDTQE